MGVEIHAGERVVGELFHRILVGHLVPRLGGGAEHVHVRVEDGLEHVHRVMPTPVYRGRWRFPCRGIRFDVSVHGWFLFPVGLLVDLEQAACDDFPQHDLYFLLGETAAQQAADLQCARLPVFAGAGFGVASIIPKKEKPAKTSAKD